MTMIKGKGWAKRGTLLQQKSHTGEEGSLLSRKETLQTLGIMLGRHGHRQEGLSGIR